MLDIQLLRNDLAGVATRLQQRGYVLDRDKFERVEAELPGQLVHCALDGEGGLRRAVAAKTAARHQVGIDGVAVGLLVRAAIGRQRAGKRCCERFAGMAAIGAGVRDDTHCDRGKRAVAARAKLYPCGHLVPGRRTDELLFARELPLHRTPGLQGGEDAEILGKHLLLAAEPAAHPLRKHVNIARAQPEKMTKFLLHDKGRLRAGADVNTLVLASPGD